MTTKRAQNNHRQNIVTKRRNNYNYKDTWNNYQFTQIYYKDSQNKIDNTQKDNIMRQNNERQEIAKKKKRRWANTKKKTIRSLMSQS